MKKLVLVALVSIVFFENIIAQDFQGEATYRVQRKLDIKIDSTKMESGMHKTMMEMLKKQFQKTYILSFNKEASVYKQDEQLEAPQPQGMTMVVVNMGGSDVLYKNIKENRLVNQNESFSKLFLIKDDLKKHDWQLTGETKFIGEHTCYKATMSREATEVISSVSINGDKETNEKTPETKTTIITAWYAPKIPVSTGPEMYHGLPGLILEVNDGVTTMVCSKLVINPKKKLNISEPTKGKEITQEKYNAIMEKKMKEMNERYSRRDGGDGEEIKIRIGG